jgi:hypothetical protein
VQEDVPTKPRDKQQYMSVLFPYTNATGEVEIAQEQFSGLFSASTFQFKRKT